MPIYTTLDDGQSYLEELPVSLGSAVQAAAEKKFIDNPLTALARSVAQSEYRYVPGSMGMATQFRRDTPLLPAEEARQKAKELELEIDVPDQGITQGQFDYLTKIKQDENRLNSILSRAPNDITSKAALMGTSFAVAALDPLNIASAFIPVVGQAKYSAMLANAVKPLSKAAVRARVGFQEGVIGAAVLEPLNYGLAQYEQRDYTLSSSLENILFGGVLGAGLHAGVGAIGDSFARHQTIEVAKPLPGNGELLARIDRNLRDSASRVAIGQVLNGYYPNVESILSLDPNYSILKQRLYETTQNTDIFAPKPAFDPLAPNVITLKPTDALPSVTTVENPRTQSSQTFAPSLTGTGEFRVFDTMKEASDIQSKVFRRSGEVLAIKQNEDGQFVLLREFADKPIRDGNGSVLAFGTERQASKAAKSVTSLQGRNLTPVPFVDEGKIKFALFENADDGFVSAAKSNPEFVQFELNKSNTKQTLPVMEPTQEQLAAIQKAAQEQVQISQMRLADPETVERANAVYETMKVMESRPVDIATAQKEATEYEQMIRADFVNRGIESELDELKQFDDLIKETDNYAKAIESAFNCSVRKGL
jgi:hypothetical protein